MNRFSVNNKYDFNHISFFHLGGQKIMSVFLIPIWNEGRQPNHIQQKSQSTVASGQWQPNIFQEKKHLQGKSKP